MRTSPASSGSAKTEHPVELIPRSSEKLPAADGRAIGDAQRDLQESEYQPLDGPETTVFLRRFAVRLHAEGEVVEGEPRGVLNTRGSAAPR